MPGSVDPGHAFLCFHDAVSYAVYPVDLRTDYSNGAHPNCGRIYRLYSRSAAHFGAEPYAGYLVCRIVSRPPAN